MRGSVPGHEISDRPMSGWMTDARGGDGSGGADGVILKRKKKHWTSSVGVAGDETRDCCSSELP